MKKMKQKLLAGIMIVFTAAFLTACSVKFDASGYTKAVLDVSYKNEAEEYIELTRANRKDAEALFEQKLDAVVNEFAASDFPEDLKNKYRELLGDMMKQVKYSVGEAAETEDKNYTVDVTVEPMTIFTDTYEEFQKQSQEYTTRISNDVMNGADMPSETEMHNQVYEIYYNVLRAALDEGVGYGEQESITVHVNKNEDDKYGILEEDLTELDKKLISMDIPEE